MTAVDQHCTAPRGQHIDEADTSGKTTYTEDISLFAVLTTVADRNSTIGEWDFVPRAAGPPNTPNAPSEVGDDIVTTGASENGVNGHEDLQRQLTPTVLQPPSIADLQSTLNEEYVDSDSDSNSDCDSVYETAREEFYYGPDGSICLAEPTGENITSQFSDSDKMGQDQLKQLDLILLSIDRKAAQLSEDDKERFWKGVNGVLYRAIEKVQKKYGSQGI